MNNKKVKIIKAVNIVLGAFACVFLALTLSQAVSSKYGDNLGIDLSSTSAASNVQTRNKLNSYDVILSSALYAPESRLTSLRKGQARAKSVSAARDTSITLVGIVFGSERNSYAIFEDKKRRKQDLFKKGAEVFNVGVVDEINKDSVVVLSNGTPYTYVLPSKNSASPTPVVSSVTRRMKRSPIASNSQKGSALDPTFSKRISETDWVIDQRSLDKALADMGTILTDARLLPYSEDGVIKGFTVSEVKPLGLFGLIGLKNGDILLRINNYPVDSMEKGMQLFNGLKGENNIAVDLLRRNKNVTLNYEIR
ncbi:MAG: hypothetical protein KAR06_02040 [Deltaproteobacteria bacterium]|nr:hypothetical protein [Deltaproteobacteria bacterium]